MPKKVFRIAYAVNYVIQAGFCFACPAGLFLLLGWLMTHRWGVGGWAMVAAVVLGVLCGVYSMFRYILTTSRCFDPTDRKGGQPHDKKTG